MWLMWTTWALGLAMAIEEPADSDVETLTIASFQNFVLSHPFSIVEFYAPWCRHCKALASKYRAAASRLRGKVAFGRMDDTNNENQQLRAGTPEMYNFTTYPALTLFFDDDKSNAVGQQRLPSDGLYGPKRDALGNLWDRYYGGYETEEMVWWLTQMLEGKNPIIEEREVLKPGLYKAYPDNVDQGSNGTPAVLDVDSLGLDMIANPGSDDNRLWVVEFYSDRCQYCKQLIPEVIKAARNLKRSLGRSKVGFAAINARVFFEDAEKWGITGLPWLTAYYRGQKLQDMSGLSDANSIIRWTNRMYESHWRKKERDGSASKASSASPYGTNEQQISIPAAHSLGPHVAELTLETYTKFVRGYAFSIIKFYAPWCGQCRALAPKFEEAAKQLSGKVAFGKIDDTHQGNRPIQASSPEMYNFTHFPALILFFSEAFSKTVGHQVLPSEGLLGPKRDTLGNFWDKYYGGTETEEIVWWLKQMLEGRNPIVEEREVLRPGLYRTYADNVEEGANSKPAVVEIDPVGFRAITNRSKDDNRLWFVAFYSDRCPHCKQLLPEVVEAAKTLKSTLGRKKIGFAAINARVFYEETEHWGITGLPWVTAWYKGLKLEDMAGLSDANSIVRWASHIHQMHWTKKSDSEIAHKRGTLFMDSRLRSHNRLAHCINAGICACEDRPRCLCAANPKVDGCCNMGCGTCDEICRVLAANPPPEEEDDDEPPDLPMMPPRTQEQHSNKQLAVEIYSTGDTVAESTSQLPSATTGQTRSWRDELGAHTWFFLHTLAAKYPENPCEADKAAMRWQVASLAQLYPCTLCRAHIRRKLLHDIEPVNVTDRATLSSWFCRLHNLVNADLGKPIHDCTLRALDAIYLKDCADCSIGSPFRDGKSTVEQDHEPMFLAAAYAADPSGYIAAASSAHG